MPATPNALSAIGARVRVIVAISVTAREYAATVKAKKEVALRAARAAAAKSAAARDADANRQASRHAPNVMANPVAARPAALGAECAANARAPAARARHAKARAHARHAREKAATVPRVAEAGSVAPVMAKVARAACVAHQLVVD